MKNNRVLATCLSVLVLGVGVVIWRSVVEPAPRNLVLIVMDTERAEALHVYGNPADTSPNLDQFAHGATLFDNAYSPGSYTAPSFLSYMSSVAVRTHGWDYPVDGTVRFPRPGFCTRTDLTTLAELLGEHGFENHAFSANGLLHPKRGFPRGFSTWNTLDVEGLARRRLSKAKARFRDRQVVEEGIAAIRDWEPGRRHFLYLHMMYPHLPSDPSSEARERFDLPEEPKRFSIADIKLLRESSTPEERELTRRYYQASVWDGDKQLGRVLDAIDDSGHHDDTIVVYMSDHGEENWEHGDYGHVDNVWKQLTHVPLLVRIPGDPPRRVGYPVSLIDVAPTLARALGVGPLPDTWQGTDLFSTDRPAVFTERLDETAVTIDGRFRAILDSDDQWSLFDVSTDTTEERPLDDPERLEELTARHDTFLSEVPEGKINRSAPVTGICGVVEGREEAEQREELKALGYVD